MSDIEFINNRFFTVSRELLSFEFSSFDELITLKGKAVSNRLLASKGKLLNITSIIRSRDLSIFWGDTKEISYNTVADVVEAIFGAIAFHCSHLDLISATNKLLTFYPDVTNQLIEFYHNGGIPKAMKNYVPAESLNITNPNVLEKISIVESIQKYHCYWIIFISYTYRNKSVLSVIFATPVTPKSSFLTAVINNLLYFSRCVSIWVMQLSNGFL